MLAYEPQPAGPFSGPAETHALGRATDWEATPLGPVRSWSPTLRTLVRSCLESPFPINLWCGPELVLIYNDAYRAVLGSKHPWSFARRGAEVWAEIWDEIAPMFAQIRDGGPPVYAEDAPFWVERRDEPRGGHPPAGPNAWFTFSLSAVRDEAGEIVAFLNVVSESTGRVLAERAREEARAKAEQAEARLREVFAQAPAFLAVLRGPDFVFEYVNHAYYQLVGHRELIGRPVFEALPEVRGQGFERLLAGVVETGEPFIGREVPVVVSRTRGGEAEERFVDVVYYPIREPDGVRSGVVAHGSDVTEHVLARRAAQQARAEAEEANQAKSQFLATMSHEIRTPINAILGYTDLLQMEVAGPVTSEQRAHLERVRASSQHLLALVNDVLDLAKVEAGHLDVARLPVRVREPLQQALAVVEHHAKQRGLRLEDAAVPHPEPVALGDADRIRQILVNLLSNAVKFTEAGGRIAVAAGGAEHPGPGARLAGDGPWVRLDVEDTGVGIPPEELERIFDPFAQLDSRLTREQGGTGLGLSISRQLARLMDGDLTVSSRSGEGSCFTLWLPASPAP